ncbi:hypothetical protein DACRYDRAFT_15395 [Dacryopinax primogenitus]|uniref:Uncharacterized protein n=1 Tax=Dacryopinax primogenitus (strain DJM 731) TaxID=1858805 RepID=M5GA42_DACPD|nr:uncharacterized protein DACRYDRAFT_15395 [Dacryopinax primogenitus]EJU02807.1 hypothetical protein DACRYDRAFT_15395 [Dacryopinax primogenitus]
MDSYDIDSTPSLPISANDSTTSLLAMLNTIHQELSNVKLAEDILHPSCKSSTSLKKPLVSGSSHDDDHIYAHHREGAETGGSGGGSREMADGELKAAIISVVHRVEIQAGEPVLVGGVPLIGLLETGGMEEDLFQPPSIHAARPEDMAATVAPPNPNNPKPGNEKMPEYLLGVLFDKEFKEELECIKELAFELGKLICHKEIAEEEERKLRVLTRECKVIHDGVWAKYVDRSKKSINQEHAAQRAAMKKSLADHKRLLALSTHEKKEKVFPFMGKLLKEYGLSAGKVALKIAPDIINQLTQN